MWIEAETPGEDSQTTLVEIQRYDRLESRYLTTGDFSALQQMNIEYPMETRTLIEDVLQLGEVNDPGINSRFPQFYQDTTLQTIISEAELQYANVSDISKQLNKAFDNLRKISPDVVLPTIYTQIGALDRECGYRKQLNRYFTWQVSRRELSALSSLLFRSPAYSDDTRAYCTRLYVLLHAQSLSA